MPPRDMPYGKGLTRREREIVDALLCGHTNKQMASQFGVSEQTIKNQLTTLFKKLGVRGRVALVNRVLNDRDSR